MAAYIARRLLYVVFTMFAVSIITFGLIFASGDPAASLTPVRPGQQPSKELTERIRVKYGLDQPIPVQYLRYMGNILRGDLGDSWYFHRPVSELLIERFPNTLRLALMILATALLIGIPLGVLTALKKNSALDRVITVSSVAIISMPSFLIAVLLLYVFAFKLEWFPTGGVGSWKHWILPVASMAILLGVAYGIFLRTNMLNAVSADYARTARAKGLDTTRTNLKHVLPNALIPIVTLAGIDLAYLLTGVVLIETVFGIPGIGVAITRAATQRDIPVIMGSVFIAAIFIGIMNLGADIIVARLDPRIRLGALIDAARLRSHRPARDPAGARPEDALLHGRGRRQSRGWR